MLNHEVFNSDEASKVGTSVKEYYEVLGLKEGASLEEVTARYLAMKRYIISSIEQGRRPDKTIQEVNEAYVKLKESKIPMAVNFDLEEHLRKSFTSVRAGRIKARRNKIIVSAGILIVFLIVGISFLVLERPVENLLPGSSAPEAPNLKMKGSLEKAGSIPPSESKTPAKIAQVVPKESGKSIPTESAKPTAKAVGRIETAKAPQKEPSAVSIPKAEVVRAKEKPPLPPPASKPAPTPAEEPRELKAKIEAPVVVPPAPKTAPPVEVAKAVPQEPSKQAIAERAKPVPPPPAPTPLKQPRELKAKVEAPVVPPAPKPAPPVEVAKVAKPESAKIPEPVREKEQKVASVSPSAIASDLEVRTFFENYLVKYNRKEINSFISLFSPKAIQNQKDDIEKIRNIYKNFFAQMESVNYQIAITGIQPKQDRLEVKAQYELEGIVAKGRRMQTWKGQIRWVLIREGGVLKIVSLDYQPQSSN